MGTLPRASAFLDNAAGALALSFLDLAVVLSPVPANADMLPRIYGRADAVVADHGYSEGAEYVSLHLERTQKPVLFVGLPIETPGAISRLNVGGNTGTSAVSVTAGGDGCLTEHDGVLVIDRGGTVGTDQIRLRLSLDGGRTFKVVRLGTANSYTIPYVGASILFAAGTLVTGDTVIEWHGSAPRSGSDAWVTARTNLAEQLRQFRSAILIGDLQSDTEAQALLAQINAYETENDRYSYVRASVYDRAPLASLSAPVARMTGSPTLTFAEVGSTGDTITRSSGSWVSDGFQVGDYITVAGSASNNVAGRVTGVSASVLTLDTTDLVAEGPVSNCTVTATPSLIFADSGETVTRNRGSWLVDGFRVGDVVTIDGTPSATNDGAFTVTAVTALVLTLSSGSVDANQTVGANSVSVTAGQSKAQWMAEIVEEFESIDAAPRIDLSAGRGRVFSSLTGWQFRRPAAWAASVREYQQDIHRPTWRKDVGPVGFDLFDDEGLLAEWDDRVDGQAGSLNRFTTFRTWANGPAGTFIAQSLTRATEGSILSQTHNLAVANLGCTLVQSLTEAAIGRNLILQDNGTATTESLNVIADEVNTGLRLGLLQNFGQGPRASFVKWTPSGDDVLNVPEALITGVLDLGINGTIHSVRTAVRAR